MTIHEFHFFYTSSESPSLKVRACCDVITMAGAARAVTVIQLQQEFQTAANSVHEHISISNELSLVSAVGMADVFVFSAWKRSPFESYSFYTTFLDLVASGYSRSVAAVRTVKTRDPTLRILEDLLVEQQAQVLRSPSVTSTASFYRHTRGIFPSSNQTNNRSTFLYVDTTVQLITW